MRSQSITLLAAAALLALAASPALAQVGVIPPSSPPPGKPGGHAVGAPGPIAGAGLGYLVLAGGYYVIRR